MSQKKRKEICFRYPQLEGVGFVIHLLSCYQLQQNIFYHYSMLWILAVLCKLQLSYTVDKCFIVHSTASEPLESFAISYEMIDLPIGKDII